MRDCCRDEKSDFLKSKSFCTSTVDRIVSANIQVACASQRLGNSLYMIRLFLARVSEFIALFRSFSGGMLESQTSCVEGERD